MSDKDTYLSFDDVTGESSKEVKELFQLKYPPSHVAEFDTLQIIDDIEIPAAKWNTLRTDSFVIPEPIRNSYPQFGKGAPLRQLQIHQLKTSNCTN